jgi:mRNA-degrading endonuclease RelE of RelBE toxin-antitoxin system
MSPKRPYQWLLRIEPAAQANFNKLPRATKQGVFRNLRELLYADDPYNVGFVEMLKDSKFARVRRFRVGDYRVLFTLETAEVIHQKHSYKGTLFILIVRNRNDVYG